MRQKSRDIYEASLAVIPGGVNSPVRAFKGLNMTPLVAVKGQGDLIWDADDHEYIDYCGSWGAAILGHSPASVTESAIAQLMQGSSFGIMTPYEKALASKIITHYPSVEKIRFTNSGTESTMSVIRLARGYTERPYIVKFNGNYHGHVDALLVHAGSGVTNLTPTSSSKGILEDTIKYTLSLPFNDVTICRELLQTKGQEIAAVILEPVAGNMGVVPATQEFLDMLSEETRKQGTLLIFDEVITGFRVGLKGAQGMYGIKPDLTCFGKVMSGGFPCAAFGGRAEIMDHLAPLGSVYQAGTLSGNPVAMCAGYATLLALESPGFYEGLEQKANTITIPVRAFLKDHNINACIQQVGSCFTLFFGCKQVRSKEDLATLDEQLFKRLFVYLFEQGIYFSPSPYEACFVSSAHTQAHLEKTSDALLTFLDTLNSDQV